jgi:hypothetical protein
MMFVDDKVSEEDVSSKGKGIVSQLTDINNALKETFLTFNGKTNVFEKLTEKLTSMENSSVGLLRSMGGVFNLLERSADPAKRVGDTVNTFQENLLLAAKNVQEFGGSFKDVTEVTEGLADAMGRVVFPSQKAMENMVALSKTTGLTNKEIGGMVEKLTSFGGTQEQATEKISKMAVAARQVGLDASKFIKEMSANVDKIGGFGFKDGIESLTRMTKQAQMLKTTFSSIVGNLQDTVLSPEGAIDAAAKFQMLGGAVGKLADPFQLMYMAQSDMEGLQKELVKSTQAAFTFNKETGEFKASTQDLYRLKEQAAITGAKFDDLVKAGREAAKLDYIKDKFNLDGIKPENRELLAGLAQVGKNGEVSIDIPGFGKVTETMIKSGAADKALEDYQKKASLDEKQIAIQQLTTTEKNARDTEIIRNAVLYSLTGDDAQKREEILKSMADNQAAYNEAVKDLSKDVGAEIGKNAAGTITDVQGKALEQFNKTTGYGPNPDGDLQNRIKGNATKGVKAMGDLFSDFSIAEKSEDLFVPSGGKPRVMAKGKLYEGIVGDEIAMGTNLSDALNKGGGGIGGKIDININLSGSVGGDPGQLTNMFNSPQVQKQIMDTVLYKLNEYKRQQGVLS